MIPIQVPFNSAVQNILNNGLSHNLPCCKLCFFAYNRVAAGIAVTVKSDAGWAQVCVREQLFRTREA